MKNVIKRARDILIERGKYSKKNLKKWKLLKEQKNACLFTGQALCGEKLEQYEIEHIVPDSQGGSNAFYNFVLTTKKTNNKKGERTPYEWLKNSEEWELIVSELIKQRLVKRKRAY